MKAGNGYVTALLACVIACVGAPGCTTVQGAGNDLERGGKGMQLAAGNAQDAIRLPTGQSYTITASADLGGSISPSGNIDVPSGSSQTFIATASAGYRVLDLLVDGQSVGAYVDLYHDDSSSYTFNNVSANHAISATFAANSER